MHRTAPAVVLAILATTAQAQDSLPAPQKASKAPTTVTITFENPRTGFHSSTTLGTDGTALLDEEGRKVNARFDSDRGQRLERAIQATDLKALPVATDAPRDFDGKGTTAVLTVTRGGTTVARVNDFARDQAKIHDLAVALQAGHNELLDVLDRADKTRDAALAQAADAVRFANGGTLITQSTTIRSSSSVVQKLSLEETTPRPASSSWGWVGDAGNFVLDVLSKIAQNLTYMHGGQQGVGMKVGNNLVYVPGEGVKVGVPTGSNTTYVLPSATPSKKR